MVFILTIIPFRVNAIYDGSAASPWLVALSLPSASECGRPPGVGSMPPDHSAAARGLPPPGMPPDAGPSLSSRSHLRKTRAGACHTLDTYACIGYCRAYVATHVEAHRGLLSPPDDPWPEHPPPSVAAPLHPTVRLRSVSVLEGRYQTGDDRERECPTVRHRRCGIAHAAGTHIGKRD